MSGGATVEELKDVLRETLENRGALGNVRAHLRAEVSNALEDRSGATKRPELSDENLIINELIREYLVFNRYRSTLSVLLPRAASRRRRRSTATSWRARCASAKTKTPGSSRSCTRWCPATPSAAAGETKCEKRSEARVLEQSPTQTVA